jgi:dihydroorotase-like cyclic amidohydrolase
VLAGEVHLADVAIADGVIAGIGADWDAETTIDLDGAYLALLLSDRG